MRQNGLKAFLRQCPGLALWAVAALLAPLVLAAQTRGPIDQQRVDPVLAARGQALYATACAACHGPEARGTNRGPDLIRSSVVQHDLYGDTLGPFLLHGHPRQGGPSNSNLTQAQILDLSNDLHREFDATLSRSPGRPAPDIVVGDAQAGQAWFNGAGQCHTCHSPTGDLAGIASRYDDYTLQQRFIFPGGFQVRGRRGGGAAPKPAVETVTVTPPAGPAIAGALVRMDDFTVILRDAQGQTRTITRVPGMRVDVHNPLAFHIALLKTITDRQMHDVLAYLETLR